MVTFIIKLAVAVAPLCILVTAANLQDQHFRRRLYVACRGRRVISAMNRALAVGTLLR